MTDCDRYQEMISRLIDGDLTKEERGELAAHVESCSECAALYVAFRSVSEELGSEAGELPEGLHENMMAAIRRESLREKNRAANARMRRWRPLLAIAACFALIVAVGLGSARFLQKDRDDVRSSRAEKSADLPMAAFEAVTEGVSNQSRARGDAGPVSQDCAPADSVEAVREPAESEETAGGAAYDFGEDRIVLGEEASKQLLEKLTVRSYLPDRTPDAEYFVLCRDEDGERELHLLIVGEAALYVRGDGDNLYWIDGSAEEILALLGLS
ncbi:MAG: zf-HC2 domain-containing protein [Oscillospiraceae bacterium]|nr:zf-HC2 domain-containing protein [Oscillospiraceae bacterium]